MFDVGSLNALYVYEAKMSLLIRVAQTPFGAAKLNEARLYHCLSQCDFIDVKAIHEGKFEGKGGSSCLNFRNLTTRSLHR